MMRDKCDYKTNNVYTWRNNRPWKKSVSFSDMEAEYFYNTMAITESDNSVERVDRLETGQGTSTPAPPKNGKYKAKSKWSQKKGEKKTRRAGNKRRSSYFLRHQSWKN